ELEGRTLADAARLLGVAVGTVASRLARGREMLATRLRRRGWGAAGVALGLTGSLPEAVAARALTLIPSSGVTAVEVSPVVSELPDGVARAMLRAKLTAIARVVLGVGVFAGVVWAGSAALTARQSAPPPPPADKGNEFAGRLNPP